jgi:hypothetical protein
MPRSTTSRLATTSVTFGRVSAASFTVDSPYRITATPPAYSSATACAPLSTTGVYAGQTATNDICQVQVRVGNANGLSQEGQILPPDEGPVTLNVMGVLVAPAGCGCETEQAPTEYDYVPKPTITSVSTSGAANLASEQGGTVITVHGTGLDPLTVEWADFGPPSLESSQDRCFVFMTGTEMQITAPAGPLTTDPLLVPFRVRTLAGQSSRVNVTFAGVPHVTRMVNTRNHTNLDGTYGALDTGGTPIRVSGTGFAGQLAVIQFVGRSGSPSFGTQYTFNVSGASSLGTQTVGQTAASVDVQLCTVSGCSNTVRGDRLYLYAPGNPDVTSVSPSSGPAAGGTQVTIDGHNLGCATGVFFGKTKAESFTPTPTAFYCGSTITLTATSPNGPAGKKVPVSVETVESFFSHTGHGITTADFKYK